MTFDRTERKSCIKCDLLTFDGRLFTFIVLMTRQADDGQLLHTLRPAGALAFRARHSFRETHGGPSTNAWTSSSAHQSEITRALHDIRSMSFRVELWDQHALHIRWVIAAAGSVFLARAAFEEAIKQWPDQKLTLRQGIMLISEHPSPLGNPR